MRSNRLFRSFLTCLTWLFFLCLLISTAGCSSKSPPDLQYLAGGSLLETIKDFQRLAREDLYRFPIPKDVTGANIMKATLVRLEDYKNAHPGGYSDIVDFHMAMAYERLRDYEEALEHYRKVAQLNGRLADQSKKNIKAIVIFQSILEKPLPTRDPFKYIKALDDKVQAWNETAQAYQGTPYEYLAREEEERIDRAKVAFAELNRSRLKDGNRLVILGYSQLITKHRLSKNFQGYLLSFGDYYVKLAKDYAFQNDPEGLSFELETFDHLVKSALKYYTEVAQQDGIAEKIEAEGKIKSLQALTERIRRLNR